MGREKEKMEETEAAWGRKAQVESIICSVCSQQIPYCDVETYYRTNMCGYCSNQDQKDD